MRTSLQIVGILSVLLFAFEANAQDTLFARKMISILCSDALAGRGYVHQGDSAAAEIIASDFKSTGLKSLPNSQSYFQYFNFDINTFPGRLSVKLNGTKLIPGKDYLVGPESPACKEKFNVVVFNKTLFEQNDLKEAFLNKDLSKTFVVIEEQGIEEPNKNKSWQESLGKIYTRSAGIIRLNRKKLTWSTGTELLPVPEIEILVKDDFDPKSLKNISIDIENRYIKNYRSKNVVGLIEGEIKDTFLLVTAHYDHLGMMGKKAMFKGANDNASGTAMMLNLSHEFAKKKPKYSMVFIAFAAEEVGLIGSKYFTDNPLVPLKQIKFVFNIDLMGGGDKGATIVNGSIYADAFTRIEKINADNKLLAQIKKRGKAANSDHYWFSEKGVPAFFMYAEGGVTAYHDINDTDKRLPLTKYSELFTLMKLFLEGF